MDIKTKDSVFAVLLLLLGSFVVWESLRMVELATKPPFNITDLTISPGFLSLILGTALLLLALLLLMGALAGESAPLSALGRHLRTCACTVSRSLKDRSVLNACGCVLIMAVYTFGVLTAVPFVVGAVLFLVALMSFARADKFWVILVTSGVSVGLIVLLFETIFKTTLP